MKAPVDLTDPRQTTPLVIQDAIKNIFFIVFLAGIVFGLSKVSWWIGVVPFWILVAFTGMTSVQYVIGSVADVLVFFAALRIGFRGNWREFRLTLLAVVGTIFKFAECGIAILLMWWLWHPFYK